MQMAWKTTSCTPPDQRETLQQGRVRLGDDVCFGKSNWLRPERGRVVRWSSDDNWDAEVVVAPSDRSERRPPWRELRRNLAVKQLADVIGERDLAVAAPTSDWRQGDVRDVTTRPPELVIRGPWRARERYSLGDDVVRMSSDGSPYQLARMASVYRRTMRGTQYACEWLDPEAGNNFIGVMEPSEQYASAHPRGRAPDLLDGPPGSDTATGWAGRKPAKNQERAKAKASGGAAAETLGLHLVLNEVRMHGAARGGSSSCRRRVVVVSSSRPRYFIIAVSRRVLAISSPTHDPRALTRFGVACLCTRATRARAATRHSSG